MREGEVLFLNRNEVSQLISPREVLALTEEALVEYSKGDTINPSKLSLPIFPYHEGLINSMPSYMKKGDIAGVKIVSVFDNNPRDFKLPTTVGTIVLYNSNTGIPFAIMDGTYITDMRTGAVSGVKAKYLARKDSRRLAIIGGGAQGFTSMEMTLFSLPGITDVQVCDLSDERCDAFIEKGKETFPNVNFSKCSDHRDALKNADITVYATSANRPLLENGDVKEGATVILVCETLTRTSVGHFDKWYVDFEECALDRYNVSLKRYSEEHGIEWDPLTGELVTGEIGDVITGKTVGRENDTEKILSGAVGMSVEDVIAAKAAYDAAVAKGVGKVLDFQCLE